MILPKRQSLLTGWPAILGYTGGYWDILGKFVVLGLSWVHHFLSTILGDAGIF